LGPTGKMHDRCQREGPETTKLTRTVSRRSDSPSALLTPDDAAVNHIFGGLFKSPRARVADGPTHPSPQRARILRDIVRQNDPILRLPPLDRFERTSALRHQLGGVCWGQPKYDPVLVQRGVTLTVEDVDRAAKEETALCTVDRDYLIEAMDSRGGALLPSHANYARGFRFRPREDAAGASGTWLSLGAGARPWLRGSRGGRRTKVHRGREHGVTRFRRDVLEALGAFAHVRYPSAADSDSISLRFRE